MVTILGPRSPPFSLTASQHTAAAPVPGSSWNRTLSLASRPQVTRQATSAHSPLHPLQSPITRTVLDRTGDPTFSPLSDLSLASVSIAVAVTQTTRLVATNHALIPASSASASAFSVHSPGQATSQPPTHQSARVASSLSFGGNFTTRGPALLSASPPPTLGPLGRPASLFFDSSVGGATSIGTTALSSGIPSNNTVAIFSATGTSTLASSTAETRARHSRLDTQQHVVSRSFYPSSTAPTTIVGSVGTSIAPSAIMAATTTDSPNAVDILLSALPTGMASSLVSDFNSLTSELAISIAGASTLTTSASSTASSPTSILGASTLHQTTSSATTSNAHSIPGASTRPAATSNSISSITSTIQTASPTPSALSTSSNSLADKQSPSMSPKQLKNASVAGIATGAAAGVVLIMLLTIFLLRRRARGQSPFRPRRSHPPSSSRGSKRVFPEVAWLYDPTRTPSQHSRATAPEPPAGRFQPSSPPLLPPLPQQRELLAPTGPTPDEDDNADTAPLLAPAPTAARWGGPVPTEYRDSSPPPSAPRSRAASPAAGRMSRFVER